LLFWSLQNSESIRSESDEQDINDLEDEFILTDTETAGTAVWQLAEKTPVHYLEIEYKGNRTGWQSSSHDFNAKVPGDAHHGFSVAFRDTKMGLGFGSYFYQKFALLPPGETDKKKSLYTVRMDTPHFASGAKQWKVYRGYSKVYMGLVNLPIAADSEMLPIAHVYCSQSDLRIREEITWAPQAAWSCSWMIGPPSGKIGVPDITWASGLPILQAEFNQKDERRPKVLRPKPDDDLQRPAGATDDETRVFLAIATALQQAFAMGGSGN